MLDRLNSQNITILAVVVAILTLFYNAYLPIHPDESYYWYWSKRLELGYFDHPPFIAYFIKLTTFFSDNIFFIRLVSFVSTVAAGYYMYKLTYYIYNQKSALVVVVLYIFSPLVQTNATIATIDAPMVLFWSGMLYYGYLAIDTEKKRYIYLTGIFMGLVVLSKLTGVLLLGAFGLYVIIFKPKLLKNIHIYLAIIVAILINSGFIYWQITHDWISFTFQLGHKTRSEIGWNSFAQYIGGLFLIIGPLFFILYIIGLFKEGEKIKKNETLYLFFVTFFIFLFFAYKAIKTVMILNWFAPIILSIFPFLGYVITKYRYNKTFIAGVILSAIFIVIIKFPDGIVPPKANHLNFFYGYKEAIAKLKELRKDGEAICTDHPTTATMTTYYLDSHPTVHQDLGSRMSMFKIWKDPEPKECIAIVHRKNILKKYKQVCSKKYDEYRIETTNINRKPSIFYIFRCVK